MSFSLFVKKELSEMEKSSQCCILAEETGKALMEGRLDKEKEEEKHFDGLDYKKNTEACCKKSFLRGIVLSAGFVNDRQKAYHLEIANPEKA